MEEQQIQAFVHKISVDNAMRGALAADPVGMVMREGFSPRVAQIIFRLVPHLAFDQPLVSQEKWWHA
jgi:hypothetical protein